MISIEDFQKIEIKIGTVLSAEPIEGSEKLLKLQVDFGPSASYSTVSSDRTGSGQDSEEERNIRQILAGIAQFYKPEELVGKQMPFITNMEPRKMMGLESQGMLMAADPGNNSAVLLVPDKEVPPGTKLR